MRGRDADEIRKKGVEAHVLNFAGVLECKIGDTVLIQIDSISSLAAKRGVRRRVYYLGFGGRGEGNHAHSGSAGSESIKIEPVLNLIFVGRAG